jgi:hypothetical protein
MQMIISVRHTILFVFGFLASAATVVAQTSQWFARS